MSIFDKLLKRKTNDTSGPGTASVPGTTPSPTCSPHPAQNPFDVLFAKGVAAATARDFASAIDLYDQAIAADPSRAETYYKRANALKDLGRLDEALAGYDEAIRRKPDHAYAYCNRGYVQHRLGLLAESAASYDQAIALEPTDAFAHYNRALLLQDQHRWPEAIAAYDEAIACNPNFADAYFNRALTSLFQGDFANGWRDFEWRWKNAARLSIGQARDFAQPLWLGEQSIAGRRLLLHAEQGLGDTMQFSRYATLCAGRGATVILEVQKPLVGLMSTLDGVSEVIAQGSPLPPFDYHCPLMSLPLAHETRPDTVPATPGYLRSDPARVAQWRAALGERTRPRVGLVWSGNASNLIDARRSIALADWVPQLPRGFEYFRLQNDVRPADQATLDSSDLIVCVDDLDFVSTAALCECLDIVICVDTSVAHLSGALGQKTWMLLPFVPDWRWMRDREDTPWYPSMKLYRQKTAGDWHEVFGRIAADLRCEFGVSIDAKH